MMPLNEFRKRIVDGARENRELWISLTCLWLVAWAAAGYGQQVLLPQVTQNTQDIIALKGQVTDVQSGVDTLNEKFDENRAEGMRARIFENGVKKCEAEGEAAQLYDREIKEVQDRYEALTGRIAPAPPRCSE